MSHVPLSQCPCVLYGDGTHPILINSGYRSEEVNKRVGGEKYLF